MSRRLTVVLACVFVMSLACAAYAEVQNVRVSGDVMATGIMRNKLALTENAGVADFSKKIDGLISQVRVRVDSDLTDNVGATVRLLSEKEWGAEGDSSNAKGNNTEVDIDLAYLTLKEFLNSPTTITIGRQELKYGHGFIIGDPDTNGLAAGHGTAARYLANSIDDLSVRKAFDAIKVVLNYDPLVIDLVGAKIDENQIEAQDDVSLVGANVGFALSDGINSEVYLWQRTRQQVTNGASNGKDENLRTAGARIGLSQIENVYLGLEGAFQFGDHLSTGATGLYPNDNTANSGINRKVTAYAIQAIASLGLPGIEFTPTIGGSYTYLSGDDWLSTDNTYRGWDPMFEDQAGGTLYNKILGYTNAQIFNLNGSIKPMEDVTLALNYWYLRLNQPFASAGAAVTVNTSGVPGDPTYSMKSDKKNLGQEFDVMLTYDYTEDVQFMLNTGAFLPGTAFNDPNDDMATQVIGSMKVSF
jgi:hypothetical protein